MVSNGVGNRKGIFFPSLLKEWGTLYDIAVWVWGKAPAKNKFGLFLASQNTSGQVLLERWLPPPEIEKVAPREK